MRSRPEARVRPSIYNALKETEMITALFALVTAALFVALALDAIVSVSAASARPL